MYIGRFVILGKTASGNWYLAYRVSSRSFPNRLIRAQDDRAVVLPTASPYERPDKIRHNLAIGNGNLPQYLSDLLNILWHILIRWNAAKRSIDLLNWDMQHFG